MKQPRRPAVVLEAGTITELLAAFRIRKAELGLNMTKIDALAGFEFGYAGKLFSRPDSKAHRRLTDFSLPRLLSAFECKLVLVPSDEMKVFGRLKALADLMRASSPHDVELNDIIEEKVSAAEKKLLDALTTRQSMGGKAVWRRYSSKKRSRMMKELASARWKRPAAEACSRAAKIRWAKHRAAVAKMRQKDAAAKELRGANGPT